MVMPLSLTAVTIASEAVFRSICSSVDNAIEREGPWRVAIVVAVEHRSTSKSSQCGHAILRA